MVGTNSQHQRGTNSDSDVPKNGLKRVKSLDSEPTDSSSAKVPRRGQPSLFGDDGESASKNHGESSSRVDRLALLFKKPSDSSSVPAAIDSSDVNRSCDGSIARMGPLIILNSESRPSREIAPSMGHGPIHSSSRCESLIRPDSPSGNHNRKPVLSATVWQIRKTNPDHEIPSVINTATGTSQSHASGSSRVTGKNARTSSVTGNLHGTGGQNSGTSSGTTGHATNSNPVPPFQSHALRLLEMGYPGSKASNFGTSSDGAPSVGWGIVRSWPPTISSSGLTAFTAPKALDCTQEIPYWRYPGEESITGMTSLRAHDKSSTSRDPRSTTLSTREKNTLSTVEEISLENVVEDSVWGDQVFRYPWPPGWSKLADSVIHGEAPFFGKTNIYRCTAEASSVEGALGSDWGADSGNSSSSSTEEIRAKALLLGILDRLGRASSCSGNNSADDEGGDNSGITSMEVDGPKVERPERNSQIRGRKNSPSSTGMGHLANRHTMANKHTMASTSSTSAMAIFGATAGEVLPVETISRLLNSGKPLFPVISPVFGPLSGGSANNNKCQAATASHAAPESGTTSLDCHVPATGSSTSAGSTRKLIAEAFGYLGLNWHVLRTPEKY